MAHTISPDCCRIARARLRLEASEHPDTMLLQSSSQSKTQTAPIKQVVSWLDASGLCRASLANLDEVAGQGQLRAIIWLSDRGSRASTLAVDRAAIAGHADVVDYLLRNRHEVRTHRRLLRVFSFVEWPSMVPAPFSASVSPDNQRFRFIPCLFFSAALYIGRFSSTARHVQILSVATEGDAKRSCRGGGVLADPDQRA